MDPDLRNADLDELERDEMESPGAAEPLEAEPTAYAPSVAERLAIYQRAGGIVTPLITIVFAFFMGGLVVFLTHPSAGLRLPYEVYKGIFFGSGLDWFFHFGSYHIDLPFTNHQVFFWWNTSTQNNSAYNLQQTLILTSTLILTGLAVAFAFRCGLFNIGGQGQYFVGVITGIWIGTRFPGMNHGVHILFAMAVAAAAGALWAAIAGFLKATTGAHEVISTIMLNWIAYWIGVWVFGQGGPLQGPQKFSPTSAVVVPSARLPVFWGIPLLQGVHIGFFIALFALVAFWFTLQRTTLGYEVRAVGFNPDAARYGGISVKRNYVVAMAVSGMFAGIAGAIDMLGYLYQYGSLDVQVSTIGFIGIAVALLGRNKAVGVGLSALLFACLIYGTSGRGISSNVIPPELTGNLALMIQAFVLLFIGADVLILYVWQARKKLVRKRPPPAEPQPTGSTS
ncbi:MAG TPA: ABC transporter permease [Gaiellaceae bacterium]|nr:ABC transporter permease [Gaiellaceae bacterium]